MVGQYYESILWDEDIPRARRHFNERRTGERATVGLTLRLKPGPGPAGGVSEGFFTVELFATGVYRSDEDNGEAALIGTYGALRHVPHPHSLHEDPSNIEDLEKALSKVLSGIGRDLNESLSSAQGFTSALKRKIQPGDPGLDQIEAIETHIENSQLQARQLLWLANGGKQDHQRFRINPNDRRVTFRLKTPRASEVLLAGDFNGWNPRATPLKKDRNGFWKTTLILPSGRYEFKFMVDGRWRESLETELTASNSYGTLNNVVVVGGG